MDHEPTNLPAQIANALVSIPKGLTPGVIKALDRLVGATVDVPVAWLNQKKAKIDAQTESYKLVEACIAQSVVSGVEANPEIAQRAMNTLIRKEYRKQTNREAVAAAMVEDLLENAGKTSDKEVSVDASTELDDDWLNIFERYAEDASGEQLQGLWGKVLSGEVRQPGRFSARTLRFLSEFSQADALTFENFAQNAFGDCAPTNLAFTDSKEDISDLLYLEASGLILGVTAVGLYQNMTFNDHGEAFIQEGNVRLVLHGKPGTKIKFNALVLTPLGREVLSLVGGRNIRESARVVAKAIRTSMIYEAYIFVQSSNNTEQRIEAKEVLWVKEIPESQSIDGSAN